MWCVCVKLHTHTHTHTHQYSIRRVTDYYSLILILLVAKHAEGSNSNIVKGILYKYYKICWIIMSEKTTETE